MSYNTRKTYNKTYYTCHSCHSCHSCHTCQKRIDVVIADGTAIIPSNNFYSS